MRPREAHIAYLFMVVLMVSRYADARGVQTDDETRSIDVLLRQAVGKNEKDAIERLLREGADPNNRSGYLSGTPLHSVRTAEIALVLLANGANPNLQNEDGQTALYMAVRNKKPEVAKVLLENGADPNILMGRPRLEPKEGPLHKAAREDYDLVKLLLEHGADPNLKSGMGHTPLYDAADAGNLRTCRLLLEYGANVLAKTKYGQTPWFRGLQHGQEIRTFFVNHLVEAKGESAVPLHWWASIGRVDKMAKILKSGADIEAKLDHENTALHIAAKCGQINACEMLLQAGADSNAREKSDETALRRAALIGNERIVEMLLDHGADPNARESSQDTALHWAATPNVCRLILKKGGNLRAKNLSGATPLIWAALRGHWNVVNFLIEAGADLNAMDESGHSALYYAMMFSDNKEAALSLLNKGALVAGTKMWDGKNILHWAVEGDYQDILQHLLKSGNSPNVRDNKGQTPLYLAAGRSQDLTQCLLENGADPNIQDEDGLSPLHIAILYSHIETVRLLLQHGADPALPIEIDITIRPRWDQNWDEISELLEKYLGDKPLPHHFRHFIRVR